MKKISILLALATLFFSTQLTAGQTKISEHNQTIISFVRILEEDPFDAESMQLRATVLIAISVGDKRGFECTGSTFYKAFSDKKYRYFTEVSEQYKFGMGAFILEYPDRKGDQNAVQFAGVESVIKTYQAMLKARRNAKYLPMDNLVSKYKKGELQKIVEDAKCGEGKTEPVK